MTACWHDSVRSTALGAIGLALAGCAGVLPRGYETTASAWDTFEAAKAAFDQIEPGRSTLAELGDLGYDPDTAPNTKTLSYLELLQRFLPTQAIGLGDLDPDVRRCLEAHNGCQGIEVQPKSIQRQRVGNAFLDIFNFRRETVEKGWSFSALILLRDDLVLYKTWNGSANIATTERKDNPLGPLQDLGGFAADRTLKQF